MQHDTSVKTKKPVNDINTYISPTTFPNYSRHYPNKERELHTLPEENNFSHQNTTYEIISALKQLQAPEVDIDTFSGNPIDFQCFLATFIQAVETKIEDPYGRLTRLIKYTDGEAKELIKSCIYLPAKTPMEIPIK